MLLIPQGGPPEQTLKAQSRCRLPTAPTPTTRMNFLRSSLGAPSNDDGDLEAVRGNYSFTDSCGRVTIRFFPFETLLPQDHTTSTLPSFLSPGRE